MDAPNVTPLARVGKGHNRIMNAPNANAYGEPRNDFIYCNVHRSEMNAAARHADLSTKLDPKRMLASSEALLTRIQQSAAAAEIAKDEAVTRAAAAREATADIAPLLTALKELREETRQLRTEVAEVKAAQSSCCVIA